MDTLDEVLPDSIHGKVKVFLNGCWVGCFDEADSLVNTLLELRRRLDISFETSIILDTINNDVLIFTDAGRTMRPLYIVQHPNLLKINMSHIKALQMGEK